tara:strand:+ start:414 stop:545 length:132 start_codon:yes stop_codon:yes gene_type:complete
MFRTLAAVAAVNQFLSQQENSQNSISSARRIMLLTDVGLKTVS